MSQPEDKQWKREELRGIFTLGLMAVLIAFRISHSEVTSQIFGRTVIFTEIIDFTLLCWSIYAFAIIIWLSSDFLPKNLCEISYAIGLTSLLISFFLYYLTALAIAIGVLPQFLNIVVSLLLLLPIFYLEFRAVYIGSKKILKLIKNLH